MAYSFWYLDNKNYAARKTQHGLDGNGEEGPVDDSQTRSILNRAGDIRRTVTPRDPKVNNQGGARAEGTKSPGNR